MLKQRRGESNLCYYTHDCFQPFPWITHGFFTRWGGCSPAPFDELNVGLLSNDSDKNVQQNLKTIQQALYIPALFPVKQVHGTTILTTKELSTTSEADAIVTDTPGEGLLIQHADCQAALVLDPIKRVIAAIHCGWQGNVKNIYAKVVAYLHERWSSEPKDLIVAISPSLGPKHSEFRNYQQEFPKDMWRYVDPHMHLNLWQLSKDQLMLAGIREANIHFPNICTYSNAEFFSYRREKETGRCGSVIGICL